MKKYAIVANDETKACVVGTGTNDKLYQSIGMKLLDVEKAFNGQWYLIGYAPKPNYRELREAEYPEIGEQLDMIYWDNINKTDIWLQKISEIKTKHPKEATENAENSIIDNSGLSDV